MHLVVASDNNYVSHMAALIYSVCENNLNSSNICFHVLSNGIDEESRKKLKSIELIFEQLKISFYSYTSEDIERRIGCDLSHDRSISAYARLFIPEILPNTIDRALYLDVDAIVYSSLEELANINFGDKYIAGVMDVVRKDKKIAVDLSENDVYINSGFILWNLKACRENKVVEKFVDFINEKDGNVVAMDQGTINGVLSKKIYILEPKWNALTPFFQMSRKEILFEYNMKSYYEEQLLYEAILNPVFIHFVPNYTSRPWQKGCKHPYQQKYIEYANKTAFGNVVLQKDIRSIKQKLLSYGFYYLPFSVFQKIKKLNFLLKKDY